MINKINKNEIRIRKHLRVRKKISGTSDCPRLCVFRSNSHMYAQIIDDTKGVTLVSASSLDKDAKTASASGNNIPNFLPYLKMSSISKSECSLSAHFLNFAVCKNGDNQFFTLN